MVGIVIALFLGILLGGANFFALKWTVDKFVKEKRNLGLVAVSFMVRMLIFIGLFYLFMDNDYRKAIALLVGIIIARIIMKMLIKKGKVNAN